MFRESGEVALTANLFYYIQYTLIRFILFFSNCCNCLFSNLDFPLHSNEAESSIEKEEEEEENTSGTAHF